MGVLNAFLSTWERARTTFGEGVPHSGDHFDHSAQLRGLQAEVESASPRFDWTGSGSDTYAEANGRHGRALGAMADLDQRLRAEVDRSAAVVAAGRRDLDVVRQRVIDAASTVPPTAAGERALWPVVSQGANEIAEIIQRSHGDLSAIAERLRELGSPYDEVGRPQDDATVAPVSFEGDDEGDQGDRWEGLMRLFYSTVSGRDLRSSNSHDAPPLTRTTETSENSLASVPVSTTRAVQAS
jgi:EspA/EspE family